MANMVTFLISSFLVLALLALAIYFWQKPPASTDTELLLPPSERGLFIDSTPAGQAETLAAAATNSAAIARTERRTQVLERAKGGEKSTLQEARTEDATFYEETLNLLIADADSDPKLLSLVSFVTRHDLPVNKTLAERVIDSYCKSPDRSSTAKVLHIAALSDDAAVYQRAAEAALTSWRTGRLSEVSALELRSILEGEFWLLTAPARSSGAGFHLKRALAHARRELEEAHNV